MINRPAMAGMGNGRRRRPGGWTLVELLVALAIISTFLAGVFATFIQILKVSDHSERMIEAHENARAAADAIARVLKQTRLDPGGVRDFRGINVPTLFGNRGDDDNDGRVDEEQPDGLDNDADWFSGRDDRHALIDNLQERPLFVGLADLGDDHVDEDCVLHQDQLRVAVYPDPNNRNRSETVILLIGSWEGENNVLLQTMLRDDGSGAAQPITAPLAYNVVGLNILYWNANINPPYWVEQWDAATTPTGPALEYPAAVYVAVSVYAGDVPLDQIGALGPRERIETMTATTVVNLEAVLHDPRYEQFVRPRL